MAKLGGPTDVRAADEGIQEVADSIKSVLSEKTGRSFDQFVAVQYRSQVVAGINYFIKICVSDDNFIFVRVYQDLSQKRSLSRYLLDKKESDALEAF